MFKYKAIQDYWWGNPGCDCCPYEPNEYWTLKVADTGDDVASNHGTPYSQSEVLDVLSDLKIAVEEVDFVYYDWNYR